MSIILMIIISFVLIVFLCFFTSLLYMRYEEKIDVFMDSFSCWAKNIGRKKK
jgi:hypothetical protein